MTKRRIQWAARLAVSLGLVVILILRLDLGEVAAYASRVRLTTLLAAAALMLFGFLGRTYRWKRMLDYAGLRLKFTQAYVLTLLGVFYGLITPGRVGELAKTLHLKGSAGRSLPSVLWERLSDLLLLVLMCLPWFFLNQTWNSVLGWAYLGMGAATVVGLAVLGSGQFPLFLIRRFSKAEQWVERWRDASAGFPRTGAFYAANLGGIVFYVLNFSGAYLIARDLGAAGDVGVLTTFPLIILLGNLPITIGGIGLREAVAAVSFESLGLAPETGTAFSLLWFLTATLGPGLMGLAIWNLFPQRPRSNRPS